MEEEKTKTKNLAAKDLYLVLKVRPDATIDQIEEAYVHCYDEFGPNAQVDDKSVEELDVMYKTFQECADAYEVLSDPRRREEYDKNYQNHHSKRQAQATTGEKKALWSKVTSPFTGAGNTTVEPEGKGPRIQALAYEVTADISLREAMKGTKFSFTISDPTPCEDCAGMKPVNRMQCATCRGLGYFNVDREEEIDLPPNVYDGMEIRKNELGRYDLRAQRNGDLIIKIKVREHPHLAFVGNDLQTNVPVSIYEAMLGAEIEVPTATGKVVMKIQPLTQPGRIYRLKGLGLAGGDQLVKIEIVLPQKLSGEEVGMYKKLRDLYKEPNPRKDLYTK
jgi:molecular chaperone DnaJ